MHGSWENSVGNNASLKEREDDDEEKAVLYLDFVLTKQDNYVVNDKFNQEIVNGNTKKFGTVNFAIFYSILTFRLSQTSVYQRHDECSQCVAWCDQCLSIGVTT